MALGKCDAEVEDDCELSKRDYSVCKELQYLRYCEGGGLLKAAVMLADSKLANLGQVLPQARCYLGSRFLENLYMS